MKLNFSKIILVVFSLQMAAICAHGQNIKDLNAQAAQALAKEDYAQAIRLYSEVIKLDPRYEPAYTSRGDAFLLHDKYEEAIKDFNEAIQLNPTNYLAYELRGSVYYAKQELDKAIADLTVALQAEPRKGEHFKNLRGAAFEIRGKAYSWKHDYTNAIADLTEALKFQMDDYQIYERRGVSFYEEREFGKALSDFNNAIRLNPEATLSLANRGRIYSRTGLFTNAIQDFEAVIKREPEAFRVYNSLAWLLATCADDHILDGKRAVELATKACDLSKWENYVCVDTLAAAYAETGDYERAVKYQKQAASMAGISDANRTNSQNRVDLYLQHKPYRESPRSK